MDAGGTKTEAILFNSSGEIEEFYHGRGVNPLVSGKTEAERAYFEILDALLQREDGSVSVAYVGIPALQYFGTEIIDDFKCRYPQTEMIVEPDAVMMISANLGHRDGACMVCGTGSGLYVRKNDAVREYGGWGWLIGGCGSGYILGLGAIQICAAQRDGTGPESVLTEYCARRYNDDILNHLPELYEGGRPLFASFAADLLEAAEAGDEAAAYKADMCAQDLADLICSAHRDLGAFTLILNGGIFRNFPYYVDLLRKKSPREVEFVMSQYPPVYGAALEAMTAGGFPVTEDFQDTFLKAYRRK